MTFELQIVLIRIANRADSHCHNAAQCTMQLEDSKCFPSSHHGCPLARARSLPDSKSRIPAARRLRSHLPSFFAAETWPLMNWCSCVANALCSSPVFAVRPSYVYTHNTLAINRINASTSKLHRSEAGVLLGHIPNRSTKHVRFRTRACCLCISRRVYCPQRFFRRFCEDAPAACGAPNHQNNLPHPYIRMATAG